MLVKSSSPNREQAFGITLIMKFQKTYKLDKWTEWNKFIADSMENFYIAFNFNANILEANEHTLSQFDFLINNIPNEKEFIKGKNDITGEIKIPKANEHIKLSSFQHKSNSLDFCIDNNLLDKEIRLNYESDPNWDDDGTPTTSTAPKIDHVKITR